MRPLTLSVVSWRENQLLTTATQPSFLYIIIWTCARARLGN